ncbi:MAG: hypothetical protein AB1631_19425 [Acidobacteriota bacterium]
MSDFPAPQLPAATDELPDLLIPNNNTLRMLVNCYRLCRSNSTLLASFRGSDSHQAQLYKRSSMDFRLFLHNNRDADFPMLQKDILPIKERLRADDPGEILIRCAALLFALSDYIEKEIEESFMREHKGVRPADELGELDILVTPKAAGVIAETLEEEEKPRIESEVSEMIDKYHPSLCLTPLNVGEWKLVPCHLPRMTAELLNSRVGDKQLKIAMSTLSLDARLKGRSLPGFPEDEPPRFLLDSVGEERPQIELLKKILQQCRDQGVSILVLPELRMPPALLDTVKKFLQDQSWSGLQSGKGLLLVVAGSWHEEIDGRWLNRSYVLDCMGNTVWMHDKLAEFNISRKNVRDNPGLKKQLNINDHGGKEAIFRGTSLEFCDCAVGRLAVAICAGFFHKPLEPVLIASKVNIFLVPAMTSDARPLLKRADELVRSQHAATFVANCGTVGRDHKTKRIAEKATCFYLIPQSSSEPQKMPCPSLTDNYLHIFDLNRLLTDD